MQVVILLNGTPCITSFRPSETERIRLLSSPRLYGASWFLNTRPMIYGFRNDPWFADKISLRLDLPWESDQLLEAGKVRVAQIPSIEFARKSAKYELIPAGCISSPGPVRSVMLFFNEALTSIRTVAVDTSSRTSVMLMRLILKEKFGVTPELVPMAPDPVAMLQKTDAALLIGDTALKTTLSNPHSLDLAEEWMDLTGLPFVFAVWAARREGSDQTDVEYLNRSLEMGLDHLDEIANSFVKESGWGADAAFFHSYLSESIRYPLNEEAEAGLAEFFRLAFMHGYLEDIPEIRKTGDHGKIYTPAGLN